MVRKQGKSKEKAKKKQSKEKARKNKFNSRIKSYTHVRMSVRRLLGKISSPFM
jgi:hypothetical protein